MADNQELENNGQQELPKEETTENTEATSEEATPQDEVNAATETSTEAPMSGSSDEAPSSQEGDDSASGEESSVESVESAGETETASSEVPEEESPTQPVAEEEAEVSPPETPESAPEASEPESATSEEVSTPAEASAPEAASASEEVKEAEPVTPVEVESNKQALEQSYQAMNLDQLLEESTAITSDDELRKGDLFFEIARPVFEAYSIESKEQQKAQYIADNGSEEGFDAADDSKVSTFFSNYKIHKGRKKEVFEKSKKDREGHLKEKQDLLEELKQISQNTEQIDSVRRVKEIQERWRSIGSVPANGAEQLYKSYDALVKIFYDTKSIEYDLKELDRKKNMTLKLDLCEKAEALVEEENVGEAVKQLNKLHDDFKAIGPVPREEQDNVWNRFKAASDKIYQKKRAYSDEFKQQLQSNMVAKQELCLKVEEFVAFKTDRIKDWNLKTKELLELQDVWNEIGPMPREVAKDINKQFWNNFKAFFNNKNSFFEKLESERKENLAKKQEMVKQADELKDSDEWNVTGDKLKELQQEWKKIGPVPEKFRESVYQEFKAAIDHFFEKRRTRKAGREQEYQDNLNKKKEVCTKIRELAKAEDNTFEKFVGLKGEFYDAGFVPAQNISEVLEDYVSSVEKYYETSELEETKAEGALALFHAEIAEKVPNADRILGQKEQTIRRRITAIENDIALWENNLAFFANSKTADKLKAEFEGKIKASSERLASLKNQIKIMRNIKRKQAE